MLYQSVGCSSCAGAAVGNLLAFYGIACSHKKSRELFTSSCKTAMATVTHPLLLKAVSRSFSRSALEWRRYSRFSLVRLQCALKRILDGGAPALLTFHMRHTTRDWFGVHCVVVIAVDGNGIHVIDSLGRRDGRWPNATISPNETASGWSMRGAPLIVTRRPAWVLQGLPSILNNRLGSNANSV